MTSLRRLCFILSIIALTWMTTSALLAKSHIESAQTELNQLSNMDGVSNVQLADSLKSARESANAARDRVHGPLWWLLAQVPYLGNAPEALRESTAVAADTLNATIELEKDLRALPETNELIDPDLLLVLGKGAANLQPSMANASERLNALDLTAVPSALADPIEKLRAQIEDVTPYLSEAENFAKVAPTLLGLEKPERWVVIFANTAEARPSGGFPGGWGIITADKGTLTLSNVESNDRFNTVSLNNWQEIAGIDAEILYNSDLSRVLDMGLSPDFELAGELFWNLYVQETPGPQPVGIMSMDEHALESLMNVTGPVQVDGEELTADEVVDYVTKGVYAKHTDVAAKDKALLGLAGDIFAKLKTGEVGMIGLARALLPAMEDGRIRAWSADEEVQKIIRMTSLSSGILDLKKYTHAVAVANGGGNKLEAYVQVDVQYWGGECNLNLPYRNSTLRVNLTNSAPRKGLPAYVTPRIDLGDFSPVPQGGTREILFVHAPLGSELQKATVNGREIQPLAQGIENGRWVWRFDVELPAQSERLLLVDILEPAIEEMPYANLWEQPMTIPMTVSEHVGPKCVS